MLAIVVLLLAVISLAAAENGRAAWLRYAPLDAAAARSYQAPELVVALSTDPTSPVHVAAQEVQSGLIGMLGKIVDVDFEDANAFKAPATSPSTKMVVVGTLEQFFNATKMNPPELAVDKLVRDGFYLSTADHQVVILAKNERGVLYGAFEYLSRVGRLDFSETTEVSNPHQPIRWVNQWDNLDGTIERGYAGPSISFANMTVLTDLSRAAEYARLLASIGVNGLVVNNVNANTRILTDQNIEGLGRLADVYRPWGVQLGISLNFSSPVEFGFSTFDPLDPGVVLFWQNKTDALYSRIPDLVGYLIKASSEGQPGPLQYNRTLADGANLFARALAPHGGIVMFRAFVYNHLADWTNLKNDRAKAAVDYFEGLDDDFDDNVVVQIKYGPIDFQVREPPSPLFAHLPTTATAIELQVSQEYLGQQSHLVYLAPMWKEILDFDLRVNNSKSTVSDIVSGALRDERPGTAYHYLKQGGSAAVVNVGQHDTWLGSHLAMSNLYAYGRLAWDPAATSEQILLDWTQLTFGHDPLVASTIHNLAMQSWPAYENYTGNLGVQTLTDILHTHFGPGPESQDNNGWGQWTRADDKGIGMDRSVATGTGFAGQYPPEVARVYESLETTPDNLLLWFHHVPYTHPLKSGETVIQHFYDAHYDGAATAQTFPRDWKALKGKIDDERFDAVLDLLNFQAGHSIVWRDSIVNFYHNLSGIMDKKARVGFHGWRIEAEAMNLTQGYRVFDVTPFHAASGGKAVVAATNDTVDTVLTATIPFPDGRYDVVVNYYDVVGGRATYRLWINNGIVGIWRGHAEDTLGHAMSANLDGHSATRIRFENVSVRMGDTLRLVGSPEGIEPAPVDYVAFLPSGVID